MRAAVLIRMGPRPVLAAVAATVLISGAITPASAATAVGRFPVATNVYAWGINTSGQVGDGTTTERDRPVQVTALPHGVKQVVFGFAGFSAALLPGGAVEAWGDNSSGELGDDSTTSRATPDFVTGLKGITQIAAGNGFMLALDSAGNVWSWGSNSLGQLGKGDEGPHTNTDVPGKVPGLTGITQIVAGDETSLALRSDGTVWDWGGNNFGQLGDGTTTEQASPQQVPGLTGITQVASGDGFSSFAINSAGALFAWGANGDGNLGDGTTTQRNTPVQVPDLPPVKQVSAGVFSTLAIAGTTNTLWGWGENGFGTIGDGTSTQRLSPRMTTLTGITQISEGFDVSAAVQSNGTLLIWGRNSGGALANGTPSTNQLNPVAVPGLTLVSSVMLDATGGVAVALPAPVNQP